MLIDTPVPPLLVFDNDDYLYVLRTLEYAESWLEPMTVEEITAIFDARGRPARAYLSRDKSHPEGRAHIKLLAVEPNLEDMRSRVGAYLTRYESDLLYISALNSAEMLNQLVNRFGLPKQQRGWFRRRTAE
jgi:hypothetical protein